VQKTIAHGDTSENGVKVKDSINNDVTKNTSTEANGDDQHIINGDVETGRKKEDEGKEGEEGGVMEDKHFTRVCKAMSLSICYAANSGGIATLTGTGTNLILKENADL
jgi:sodium-dependent dicarboxylate transporter 2/3/5